MPTPSLNFDPFPILPYRNSLRNLRARRLLFLIPPVFGALGALAAAEGALGPAAAFQPKSDFERIFGRERHPSRPLFPLERDVPSLVLILVIFLTIALTVRQWQLMAKSISELSQSGGFNALAAGSTIPPASMIQRMLGMPKLLNRTPANVAPVDYLLSRVNKWIEKIGRASILLLASSFILALLLALGPIQNGMFEILAPQSLPSHSRKQWAEDAYRSWWASIDHPAGFLVYVVLMALGIFVVLTQNTVGLIAVYTVLALSLAGDYDLDWLNRDRNYGWQAISTTFRTVVVSLTIHGIALSVVLPMLGARNVPWAAGVLAIWVIMLPSVTIGPSIAFAGVRRRSCASRIAAIEAHILSLPPGTLDDPLIAARYREEIRLVNGTRVSPLRVRRTELPGFLVLIALPIALTVAQIYFS